MNLTKSEINIQVSGEAFPVAVIKQDEKYYYNSTDVLTAIGFEKAAARTVKDWLRTGANDLRQYGIKLKSQHYIYEVYESVFSEKMERIITKYPEQAEAVSVFRIDPDAADDAVFVPIAERRAKTEAAIVKAEPEQKTLPAIEDEPITVIEPEPEPEPETKSETRRAEIEKRKLSRDLQLIETQNKINYIFTNPVTITFPLFAAIIASGIHVASVFMSSFPNDLASVMLAVVFSSVVLVFTFNSAGKAGTVFVFVFAFLECLLNAVYFSLFPEDWGEMVTKICATVGLPLSLVAYAYLFKRFTKTENEKDE